MKVENQLSRMMQISGAHKMKDLAKMLGVSPAVMSNWKARGEVPAKHILAAADLFEVNPEWLRKGATSHQQNSPNTPLLTPSDLTQEEIILLRCYRKADDKAQKDILTIAVDAAFSSEDFLDS